MNGQSALGIIIFVFLVIVYQLVERVFGDTGGIRFWGIGMSGFSIAVFAMKELPVKIGNKRVMPLKGAKKGLIALIAFLLGGYIALYPNEFACMVALKGYVCKQM